MSPSGHKDYSGTPLHEKLGIRAGSRLVLANPPEDFVHLLGPLPEGVSVLTRAVGEIDVAVVFGTTLHDLAAGFGRAQPRLAADGRLWIAWPKRASKVTTDVSFELAQAIGLHAGLVDNKSASITDVFQGLQFVYRVKDRPSR
jgi:hypothetical protein